MGPFFVVFNISIIIRPYIQAISLKFFWPKIDPIANLNFKSEVTMYLIPIIIFFAILTLSSCTYTINTAQVSGKATDTIDDTNSNTPNIAPQVNIPLK
jgi:hypothetical protein